MSQNTLTTSLFTGLKRAIVLNFGIMGVFMSANYNAVWDRFLPVMALLNISRIILDMFLMHYSAFNLIDKKSIEKIDRSMAVQCFSFLLIIFILIFLKLISPATFGVNPVVLNIILFFITTCDTSFAGFFISKVNGFHFTTLRQPTFSFATAGSTKRNSSLSAGKDLRSIRFPSKKNNDKTINISAKVYAGSSNPLRQAEYNFATVNVGDTLAYSNVRVVSNNITYLRTQKATALRHYFFKRGLDITFSLFIILFVLSWMVPLMALVIKLESRGPVFFRQSRSGINNNPFWCYKFRSMYVNKQSDELQATRGDSRITKVGAFLRKKSLDEFPQFFNVLLGNMSMVGPRPHMLKHTEIYSALIPGYMQRLAVKQGITGWAQINGYRGETADVSMMEKRVELDLWYIENWSVWLDIKILFYTVFNIAGNEENAH